MKELEYEKLQEDLRMGAVESNTVTMKAITPMMKK